MAGATFVWYTLAALEGTPSLDLAQRAILSVQMFIHPVSSFPDGTPTFQLGDHLLFG